MREMGFYKGHIVGFSWCQNTQSKHFGCLEGPRGNQMAPPGLTRTEPPSLKKQMETEISGRTAAKWPWLKGKAVNRVHVPVCELDQRWWSQTLHHIISYMLAKSQETQLKNFLQGRRKLQRWLMINGYFCWRMLVLGTIDFLPSSLNHRHIAFHFPHFYPPKKCAWHKDYTFASITLQCKNPTSLWATMYSWTLVFKGQK